MPSFRILFIRGAGIAADLFKHILEQRGHEVVIREAATVWKKKPQGFDFILATTYHDETSIRNVTKALLSAREANPSAKVLLGGPGYTVQPEGFLRDMNADWGLAGEADNTVSELFQVFECRGKQATWNQAQHIAGVGRRYKNGRVMLNKVMPIVTEKDLERFPIFVRSTGNVVHIYLQRGCPNKCAFCDRCFGHKVKNVPLGPAVDKIEEIVRTRPEVLLITFEGEQFLLRPRALQFLEEIKRRGLNDKMSFASDFTVGSLTKKNGRPDMEYLKLLKSAGFSHIGLGAEFFVDKLLQEVNKPQKAMQTYRLIMAIQGLEMEGHCYTITYTPKARLAEFVENRYATYMIGEGGGKWEIQRYQLELIPKTPLFDQYVSNPERFWDAKSKALLPKGTDVQALCRRRPFLNNAMPYDPAVFEAQSIVEALYMMEKRYEYLKALPKRNKAEGLEAKRLFWELRASRLAAKQVVGCWQRDHIVIVWDQQNIGDWKIILDDRFLDEWEIEFPEGFSRTQKLEGLKLFGPEWRIEIERDPVAADSLREALRTHAWLFKWDKSQFPRKLLTEFLSEIYELLTTNPVYVHNALTPAHIRRDRLHKVYFQCVREQYLGFGRERFIERYLGKSDPFGQIALDCLRFAAPNPEHYALEWIEPEESSLPYLIPLMSQSRRRKLDKLAEMMPEPMPE